MNKQAVNPYLPSFEYIPDAEPYVFGDRVYAYGSHDRFDGEVFCQNDYVCWSAPVDDLADWNYEGVIYRREQDPRNADHTHYMYAPDIVQGADGRYYLYYTLDMRGIMSVAVSDSPTGPFEYYADIQYADGTVVGEHPGDIYQFDPGVLRDEDGRIYLYTGFGPEQSPACEERFIHGRQYDGAYCIELEADMYTVKTDPVCIVPQVSNAKGTEYEGHAFFEASSIRKIDGIYYFIYSSTNCHELCYATSKYPNKDFSYRGAIVSNGDIGLSGWTREHAANYIGNNHGSIVWILDKWYVFYHRQTNQHSFSRQGCAEEIQILEDGTIPQVEMTSCGLNGKPLEGKGTYSTSILCNLFSKEGASFIQRYKDPGEHPYLTQSGEDREELPDQYIANMRDGAVAGFKYFDLRDSKEISVIVRGGKGILKVMDGLEENSVLLAQIPLVESSGYISFTVPLKAGTEKTAMFFRYEGEGAVDFKEFILR